MSRSSAYDSSVSGFFRSGRLSVIVATLPLNCQIKCRGLKFAKSTRGGRKRRRVSAVASLTVAAGVVIFTSSSGESKPAADAQHLVGDVVGTWLAKRYDYVRKSSSISESRRTHSSLIAFTGGRLRHNVAIRSAIEIRSIATLFPAAALF